MPPAIGGNATAVTVVERRLADGSIGPNRSAGQVVKLEKKVIVKGKITIEKES